MDQWKTKGFCESVQGDISVSDIHQSHPDDICLPSNLLQTSFPESRFIIWYYVNFIALLIKLLIDNWEGDNKELKKKFRFKIDWKCWIWLVLFNFSNGTLMILISDGNCRNWEVDCCFDIEIRVYIVLEMFWCSF